MKKKNICSSPSFIIDKKILDENIMNIKDGCSILNNKTIIGYSIKTNNLPFLIKYLNKQNICTEIVSSDVSIPPIWCNIAKLSSYVN